MGNNLPPKIIFIGFTSSGKTATGFAAAMHFGYTFVDLDREIEALAELQTGRVLTCRRYFNEFGAESFRELETAALEENQDREGIVLSTGGGVPLRSQNRELLAASGYIVYLRPEIDAVFYRMRSKGFPAYLGESPGRTDLERAFNDRDPIYTGLADLTIDNTHLSPKDTCATLAKRFGYA